MDPFQSYTNLKPKSEHEPKLKPKKTIAKIDRKERKNTDKRCKVDKLLGIDKPQTKHHGESQYYIYHKEKNAFQKSAENSQKIPEYFQKEKTAEEKIKI